MTGNPTPTALPGRYARVTLAEVRELYEKHGLSLKWAVWLAVHAYTGVDPETGAVWASLGAPELSVALGISRKSAYNALSALLSCGALKLARRGGNGRASVYFLPVSSENAVTAVPSNCTQLLPRTGNYSGVVASIPSNYHRGAVTNAASNCAQLPPDTSNYSEVVTIRPPVLPAETCRKERLKKSFFIGDFSKVCPMRGGVDAVNASLLGLETDRKRARLQGGALTPEAVVV